MAKKIYVGNLSFQTTELELSSMFEIHGERRRGLGSLRTATRGDLRGLDSWKMSDDEAAEKAISRTQWPRKSGVAH